MTVNVNPGATMTVVMDTPLNSATARYGQHFDAHVSNPTGNPGNSYNGELPDGTRVYGHVTSAVPKNQNNPQGFLDLSFDRVVLPNGQSYTVRAVPANVDNESVNVASDGRVQAKSNYKNVAGRDAAIGAAAGAVGDILLNHGKIDLGHVLLGGAAGYGVSTINKSQNTAQDVKINAGDKLGMKMSSTVSTGYHNY